MALDVERQGQASSHWNKQAISQCQWTFKLHVSPAQVFQTFKIVQNIWANFLWSQPCVGGPGQGYRNCFLPFDGMDKRLLVPKSAAAGKAHAETQRTISLALLSSNACLMGLSADTCDKQGTMQKVGGVAEIEEVYTVITLLHYYNALISSLLGAARFITGTFAAAKVPWVVRSEWGWDNRQMLEAGQDHTSESDVHTASKERAWLASPSNASSSWSNKLPWPLGDFFSANGCRNLRLNLNQQMETYQVQIIARIRGLIALPWF